MNSIFIILIKNNKKGITPYYKNYVKSYPYG